MVAAVVGDEHMFQPAAFGKSAGHREHYAVAERHHRAFHVIGVIAAVGNGVGSGQQRAFEVFSHETEGNHYVLDAERRTLAPGAGYLPPVMV